LAGVLVIFTLGLLWHGIAQVSAISIGLLPEGCEAFVNQGIWIPVDPCNEESRGRDIVIMAFLPMQLVRPRGRRSCGVRTRQTHHRTVASRIDGEVVAKGLESSDCNICGRLHHSVTYTMQH
jgi:hypothetical protein